MSETYDLVVIGACAGAIAAVVRAANYGARALLIESAARGESCVKIACVLKKILSYGAAIANRLADAIDYGFDAQLLGFDGRGRKVRHDACTRRLVELHQQRFDRVTLR